jgi:hypothetical protein
MPKKLDPEFERLLSAAFVECARCRILSAGTERCVQCEANRKAFGELQATLAAIARILDFKLPRRAKR